MSEDPDEDDERSEAPASAPVGYGKPPVQHQFKKGQSGNPNGRPRRNTARPARPISRSNLDELVMEETSRVIEMRENGRLVKMTVSRANLRAIQVKALRGDHRSQELLFEIARDAESRRDGRASELLRVFNEMKAKWRALCEQCDRAGEARPISIPHPDDIRFDHDRQTLTTLGPVSERGHRKEELRIRLLSEARKRLARLNIAMAEDRAFSPRCLDEKRLGEAVVGLLEDSFPAPEIRRASGFNLDRWVVAARARSAERAVTLEWIPFFTTTKATLLKRGCPSLEDFGPDEFRPAAWNVGSDGDEVDFATLLTMWLTVDREFGEEDTSDWV